MTNFVPVRPPPRELFFTPLNVSLLPGEVEKIEFAYQCSKYGHAKQTRSHGGRYFDHPKSAAWIYIHELGGRDVRIIIDLLLHDLKEDQFLLSTYRTSLNFGTEIALDVMAVTKLAEGKETVEEYLLRVILGGPWSILCKLIDRLHNIRELRACSKEKIKKQVFQTENFHLPLLVPALASHGVEWKEVANKVSAMITLELESFK